MSDRKAGPVEVWLRLGDAGFGVSCSAIFDDERATVLDVDALSIRGAEREMTAWLIDRRYKAVGRWQIEAEDGQEMEVSRKFAPARTDADPLV